GVRVVAVGADRRLREFKLVGALVGAQLAGVAAAVLLLHRTLAKQDFNVAAGGGALRVGRGLLRGRGRRGARAGAGVGDLAGLVGGAGRRRGFGVVGDAP